MDYRKQKYPCENCKKPISYSNLAKHERYCKEKDRTLVCTQEGCKFSTTSKTEFRNHNKDQHNLSVRYYTHFCNACNNYVDRKKVHVNFKEHLKKMDGFEGEPFESREHWKVIPYKAKPKRKKRKRDTQPLIEKLVEEFKFEEIKLDEPFSPSIFFYWLVNEPNKEYLLIKVCFIIQKK